MAKQYAYFFKNTLAEDHPDRINKNTLLAFESHVVYSDSEENARAELTELMTITETRFDANTRKWVEVVIHACPEPDEWVLLERRSW